MIRLEGSYTFDGPRDVVWEVLMDPDALAKALPGVQSMEKVDENTYKATMNVRVGPVQGRFQGTVKMSDVRPPEGYHLLVEGSGPQGFVKGEGDLHLEDQGEKTLLTYTLESQVGGRIAGVGQRLIESTAKSLIRQGLNALNRQVQARVQGPPPEATTSAPEASRVETPSQPSSPPDVEPPSMTQVTVEIVKDVVADMIPEEQRPTVVAAVVGFFAFLIGWLIGRSSK